MKKYILILMLILLASLVVYGASTDITGRPTSDWFSGNPDKDNAWAWMKEADNNIFGNKGTGKVFYVDSGVNIEGAGLTADSAKNTLLEGINLCTADRGDVVYVMQGHVEDGVVGTAAMWQASVSGISIIGIGEGSLMPSFHYNYTSNTCLVTADNVRLHNLRFRPSISAVTKGVLVQSGADYAHFTNCEWGYPEAPQDEFAIALQVGTSTGAVVERCLFDAEEEAAVTGITFEAAENLILRDNIIRGSYSTANINNALESSMNILIEDNILWNGGTSTLNTEPVIEVAATTVGITRRNYSACNLAMDTAYVGTLLFNFGNYYNEKQGGGYTALAIDLVPATTTDQSVIVSTDD